MIRLESPLDQLAPPSRPVLEEAVCALEHGDSRKVLDELAESLDEVQGPDPALVPIIISLAKVIRWQARGDAHRVFGRAREGHRDAAAGDVAEAVGAWDAPARTGRVSHRG